MQRNFKVSLNDRASEDLKEAAKALGISESEVLRRGLSVMRHYAEALAANKGNRLVIKEKETNQERELIVI